MPKQPTKPKFPCPHCGDAYSRVVNVDDEPQLADQRDHWKPGGIWRRRECKSCRARYTTREYVWPIVSNNI